MLEVNCKVGTKLTDIRCTYQFLGLELVETYNYIDRICGANCPYDQTTVKLLGYGLDFGYWILLPFIFSLAMALICISLRFCIKVGDRDLSDAPRSPRQAEGDQTSRTDDGDVSENKTSPCTNLTPLMKEMKAKRTGKTTQPMLEALKKRANTTSCLDNPTPAMKQIIKKRSRN